MKWMIYYCYDAYCGWCYGFSPVIRKFATEHADIVDVEVLSGGMIMSQPPAPIKAMASYIQKAYRSVEELAGITFGKDFLWHIFNPDKSDWFPNSEKPAIALSIFKEYYPEQQVNFASDLQYALNFEGRDLCDDEAYRHLLPKYDLPEDDFYTKLSAPEYKEKAHYEFALVKQLKVTGFPTVLLQKSETKFYLLARGYSDYNSLKTNFNRCMEEINR